MQGGASRHYIKRYGTPNLPMFLHRTTAEKGSDADHGIPMIFVRLSSFALGVHALIPLTAS